MDSNLNFNNFYYVRPKSVRGEFIAMPMNYDNISTEELRGYSKGIFPNEEPVMFKQSSGSDKKKPDLIIRSAMGLYLYHIKIIDIFKDRGFTGWDSYPVKVICKNGAVNEDYHFFIIKGVCGHYDVKKSTIIDYTEDTGGFIYRAKKYQGMYFDPKTWDGSDIFTMKDTWINIVTEPVMLELKKLKAKLNMTKLSEHLLVDKVEE